MFQLNDAWEEARKIFSGCNEPTLLRWMTDAAALIWAKIDTEGTKGYLDVCSVGCNCTDSNGCRQNCGRRCLTLPREVATVIGVNIGGRPALGYSQLFNFHLNGPGDCRQSCEFSWQDLGASYSTFRDLITPAKLVVYTQTPEDNNKEFIVFGYDSNGNVLRRQVAGEWRNGLAIPTIFGAAIPDDDAPLVARITGIFKEPSVGSMRLSTTDDSGATGVLLGIYEPDETTPQFRRIQLNRACNWARVAYLRNSPNFTSRYDHVPLLSRRGFLLAMQAIKEYNERQLADAHAFEADAARLEAEQQMKLEAPTYMPIQVVSLNHLRGEDYYDIE